MDSRLRRQLAVKAFAHTARYDAMVAGYLSSLHDDGVRDCFPGVFGLQFHLKQLMRYGENPHQRAAFYIESTPPKGSVSAATQLQGKALSYNNVVDSDAALECVKSFFEPACVTGSCAASPSGWPRVVEKLTPGWLHALSTAHMASIGSTSAGMSACRRRIT